MLAITIVGAFFTLGLSALAMSLFGIYEGIMYLTGNEKYGTDADGRPLV